ncbi:Hcp family type VI secretion system effector [Photorhabdus hindustanensis]|uniref:Hcp1 family type VI secretion system effector n=1 Tax=Photorhabdus hindustanensis TaxID=2918802 RepID=A0A2S8Q380_9GAMM|nr:type VI secretion system tube protein Hcp [Photorhabdus hindustanensis]PQQ26482.1 Hcp1 family type VI secretion system effector [Photorhabdus hindustanensis]
MSSSIFLQIDGITGESTDSKHKQWIELSHVNFGAFNHARIADSGKRKITVGASDFRTIDCVKVLDSSSIGLLSAVAQGTAIKKVKLEICTLFKGEMHPYAEVEMDECIISDVHETCSRGGEFPQEQLSIAYSKIKWTFTPLKEDGTKGDKVGPEGWDLIENKKQ